MQLVFASTNPDKVREAREILGALGVPVVGLDELGVEIPEPEETAATLEGNARLKAAAYARALGRPCLADDSGLEVAALGGAPGVHSARYAGVTGDRAARDRANRARLVGELARSGATDRRARLVCAVCLAGADGAIRFEARGAMDAVVLEAERGGSGFGYDALLFLPDVGKTIAELGPDELHARSHRGQALRAVHAFLARP